MERRREGEGEEEELRSSSASSHTSSYQLSTPTSLSPPLFPSPSSTLSYTFVPSGRLLANPPPPPSSSLSLLSHPLSPSLPYSSSSPKAIHFNEEASTLPTSLSLNEICTSHSFNPSVSPLPSDSLPSSLPSPAPLSYSPAPLSSSPCFPADGREGEREGEERGKGFRFDLSDLRDFSLELEKLFEEPLGAFVKSKYALSLPLPFFPSSFSPSFYFSLSPFLPVFCKLLPFLLFSHTLLIFNSLALSKLVINTFVW
jgi:hypothetical protein